MQLVEHSSLLDKIIIQLQAFSSMSLTEELKPYAQRKQELSIVGNCVLWGNSVVIPTMLRPALLDELHNDHSV